VSAAEVADMLEDLRSHLEDARLVASRLPYGHSMRSALDELLEETNFLIAITAEGRP
jgi:hypothetical protein